MGREVALCCEVTADLLEAPVEDAEDALRRYGALFFGPDSAIDVAHDALKADLARALPLMSWTDGRSDDKKLMKSLSPVTASARGPAEQFYLPAEVAEAFHRPWTPADTWLVLDPSLKAHVAARSPAAKTTGRNDKCPCGSGRKWKKCCGAVSGSV